MSPRRPLDPIYTALGQTQRAQRRAAQKLKSTKKTRNAKNHRQPETALDKHVIDYELLPTCSYDGQSIVGTPYLHPNQAGLYHSETCAAQMAHDLPSDEWPL